MLERRPITVLPDSLRYEPIRNLVFGRSARVSIGTTVLALLLAPAVAIGVSLTTGYPRIQTVVAETLQGTEIHFAVFGVAGLLIAMGTVSAALNSGLIPTHLLVSAPLFGLAITQYGTKIRYVTGEVETVPLSWAFEFATAIGLVGSVPLTLLGFALGTLVRRHFVD